MRARDDGLCDVFCLRNSWCFRFEAIPLCGGCVCLCGIHQALIFSWLCKFSACVKHSGVGGEGAGVQAHPQECWFVENSGKISMNSGTKFRHSVTILLKWLLGFACIKIWWFCNIKGSGYRSVVLSAFASWRFCNLSGGVALLVWFTTNGMCVKNNTIIYVARASNSKRDCEHDLYCCLLPQCKTLRICRSGFPIASKWCCNQDVKVLRSSAFTQRMCDRCGSL